MPPAELSLRPPVPPDEADWRRLWAGYLAFYGERLPEAVAATTFARLLADDRREPRGLLAFRAGRPVGLVHYLFHRDCWRIEDTCYLQDLWTEPAARGTGVGRALIEAVYRAADAAGCPSVYWLTQDFNHTARALYDRVGRRTPFLCYARA